MIYQFRDFVNKRLVTRLVPGIMLSLWLLMPAVVAVAMRMMTAYLGMEGRSTGSRGCSTVVPSLSYAALLAPSGRLGQAVSTAFAWFVRDASSWPINSGCIGMT